MKEMKKEKIVTIREEVDYNKIMEDIDKIILKNHLTYVEVLGILEIIKDSYLQDGCYE